MATHPRFKGPRLQRDPNHDDHPKQPADKYDPADLPAKVDLRPHMPPVVNQGEVGSCTANALAGAFGYLEGRAAKRQVAVSRLFIYYNERNLEGSVSTDAGALISDGVKVLKKMGACGEATWPYDEKKWKDPPPSHAYDEGKGHEVDQAATVDIDLHAMKHCLAEGYPFVFGLEIDDFEPDAKGFVKRPTDTKDIGGHAILCVGYDDSTKHFIVRNSWGTDWGDKGYCYVPYDWMTDPEAASDAWTLRRGTDFDFAQVGNDDSTTTTDDSEEEESDDSEEETDADEDEDEEEDDSEEEDGDEEDDDSEEEESDDDSEEEPAEEDSK